MPTVSLKFQIEGMEDYLQKLRILGPQNRRSAMLKILRSAAGVVRRNMRAAIHARSGILRRAVKVRLKNYPSSGTVIAIIGIESASQMTAVDTHVTLPGKRKGRSRLPTKHGGGYNKWGAKQVAVRYAAIVRGGRKSFTQKFTAKIGKRYYVKGHKGLWVATYPKRIIRPVGAQAPNDFVAKGISGIQERMKRAMINALNTWMGKHGY